MVSSCRFPVFSNLVRGLIVLSLAVLPFGAIARTVAQTSASQPSKSSIRVGSQPVSATASATPTPQRMRGTTNAQRKAAAATTAVRRAANARALPKVHANAIVGTPGNPTGPATLDQLYFSGEYPNYANSPLPNVADTVNCTAPNYCGIRKFVDTLPLPNHANDLGNMLPVAVPDTTTFPGSDYYEISLVQYRQQLHKDLPAVQGTWPNQTGGGTLLRGYVQTNGPNGSNRIPNYLGPIIVAQSNRPVRVKFTNALPTGAAGNLFLPTDLTSLGAGLGLANGSSPYLQNRATVHLHGGNTPWISDGTPHQWTIPAGDWGNTKYQRGDSVSFVPDMFFVNGVVVPQCTATVTTNCSDPTGTNNATTLPAGATNDPGHGALTFYYTNQESARLLFYHDHAYGITRLNVYGGEASALVIRDNVEADLTNGTNATGVFTQAGVAPAPAIPSGDAEIPLVIQDKTFVPQNPALTTVYSVPILENGSGYTAATVGFTGGCSVEPTATAIVGVMMDPFGQMITGAVTGINLLTAGSGCTSDPAVTISGDGTGAVAFASVATLSQQDPTWDPALWGGYGNLWYPHVYMTNQWPGNPDGSSVNPMGRWDYASWFWPPFNGNPGQYTVQGELPCPTSYDPTMTCPGVPSVLSPAPAKELDGSVHQGAGSTVSLTPEGFMDTPLVNGVPYPTMTVDPKPYRFRILSVANERSFNLSWFLACDQTGTQYAPTTGAVCPAPTVPGIPGLTEVGMVPAVTSAGFPVWWPSDGRAGGVPDPKAMGPSWIQIGSEGGVLPGVSVIPPSPVTYEQNMRSVTVTNVQNHGLLLMSAERADAIVDFTPYAGKTLILYNDAPAPMPAHDDRNDYYTGDADQTGTGGAPSTLAGFGPNTRTIMQVVVNATVAGQAQPAVNMASLNALIPAAFNLTQPVPVVPEPAYNKAYNQTFAATYPALQSTQLSFTPIDPSTKKLSTIITNPTTGSTKVTLPLRFKTIQELFDLDYGRMNATLGTELPLTNYNTQTTVPLGYVDPFSEDIYDSANVAMQPVGIGADGSQLWIIVHNGVDSHAIHFHLYDVQLINRYGWDGTNRVPFPDELGWKDTVRMNPLEIDFVALRPVSQSLPFPVPDSSRLFDVTKPAGQDLAMSAVDPINGAAPQLNQVQPMGWEYVWHCHLLGHEENDMMREQVFQVPPQTPLNLTGTAHFNGNQLTFRDMSLSETGFTLERATNAAFTTGVKDITVPPNPGWNSIVTYLDTSVVGAPGSNYFYRVRTFKPDADYWSPLIGTTGTPIPLANLVSAWSNSASFVAAPILQVSPTALNFGTLPPNTTSPPQTITVQNVGVGTLRISSMKIVAGASPNSFAVTGNTCTTTMAAGTTCTVTIVLRPGVTGAQSASFTIVSNAPANGTQSVALAGLVPVPLTITASSPTMNWGAAIPLITPIAVGLVPPDTLASLGPLVCTTTYTAGALPGKYPTSCSGANNPAYVYTYVAGTLTVVPTTATMISPVQGSVLPSPTQTFTWTTFANAWYYWICIGTQPGNISLGCSPTGTATSYTATNLPMTGATIYVRLSTRFTSGVISYLDYTYTGTPIPATMLTPTPGTTLHAGTATFTWTTGQGAWYYTICVGSGVGMTNLGCPGSLTTTTWTTTTLPKNGSTIYVRLSTRFGTGAWQFNDYTYIAAP